MGGSAMSNGIVALSSLVSAILVKQNWLWIQNWFVVPKIIGDLTQKIFGWLIDSSAPTESGPMGATLEIQRSQQMEAIEQHMQRQQVKNDTFLHRKRISPRKLFLGQGKVFPRAVFNPPSEARAVIETQGGLKTARGYSFVLP